MVYIHVDYFDDLHVLFVTFFSWTYVDGELVKRLAQFLLRTGADPGCKALFHQIGVKRIGSFVTKEVR